MFNTKFLGVIIDSKLNWSLHLKFIEGKLASILYILRKIRYKINNHIALKLYDTLIDTHLTYCNIIWGKTYNKYLLNVFRMQKRALRLCCLGEQLSSDKLFLKCNRLSVYDIPKFQLLLLIHKFFYNDSLLPAGIVKLFRKTNTIHSYSTRSADNLFLFTQSCRLEIRKKSVKVLAPTTWNSLPLHIRELSSYNMFKAKLKSHLFESFCS